VKCRDFLERVSAAADSCLQAEVMAEFLEHADVCPRCRSEYEAEASTKRIIASRAHMVETPASVRIAILERLEQESLAIPKPVVSSRSSRFKQPIRIRPTFAVALALVAALIVILQIAQPPARVAIAAGNNVMLQSMENYKAIRTGSITPQVASSDPENVRKLFDGRTTFPVHVPKLKDCTLVGGVLNSYEGTPLAHVVYNRGNGLVYMYQTCWTTVQQGERLMVPANVMSSLRKTGWYTEELDDGQTLALWVRGATLCAVVADVGRDELYAWLTSDEPVPYRAVGPRW
jgi:anti-sigma factor RsiW